MALVQPRQHSGSNNQNPPSEPNQFTQASPFTQASQFTPSSQITQPSPPGSSSSMTLPTSMTVPPNGDTTTPTTTSSSTSQTTPSMDTTLRSITYGQHGSSGHHYNGDSAAFGSATSGIWGTVDLSSPLPVSTTLGGIDVSASSSSSFAASTTSGTVITSAQEKCSGLSCNPGKAAAIFVPIALVLALLAGGVAFFCIRRKGRARLGQGLAFFSHGAEANYVSASASSAGSRAPSMRQANSSLGHLAAGAGLGAAGAAGLAGAAELVAARRSHQNHEQDFGRGFVPDMVSRASSNAYCAAPPPYAPRQSCELNQDAVEPADITNRSSLAAPAAIHTASDPFADTPNPFADEADDNVSLLSGDTAVAAARGNSRRSVRDDVSIVSSLQDMDEAGSIREAQVANVANVQRGPSLTGGRPAAEGSS